MRGGTQPVRAEQRVALVVGNGAYVNAPRLDNPPNDAKLVAATLKKLNFTLIGGGAQLDLDRLSLERAIREFGRAIGPGTVALFYYSGHGVQIRGTNYLVPVAANLSSASDVDFELVDADVVVRQMDAAHSSLNLIILDACRNNPFGGRGLRDGSGGLAEMRAPKGTLISYATQPGGVARDGDPGGDSPYTTALTSSLQVPGIDVFKAFNQVGLKVSEATGGTQVPWLSSSPIDGEFYLAAPPPVSPPAVKAAPPPTATATVADQNVPFVSADREALFWQSIEHTTHPEELQAYLHQFPNGTFADLARTRLTLLETPRTTQAPESIGPAQLAEAQRLLQAMGISRAPVNGRAGPLTAEAIRLYQRAAGVPETGDLSSSLLAQLRGAPPPTDARAGAAVALAGDEAQAGRNADAIALYQMGLRLAPDNEAALHALADLQRPREPPRRDAVFRPPVSMREPARPRQTPQQAPGAAIVAPAPERAGFSAVAADGTGRRFAASGAASEGDAMSAALSHCHAAGESGGCRIISLGRR